MAYKVTKEQLLEAIENSQGIITTVAAHLRPIVGGKPDWHTVRKWVDRWEETKQALKDERESMLDLAENIIFQEIAKHDVATAKWYLKAQGKDRGYEEVPTLKLDQEEPLNINFNGMTAEGIAAAGNVELNDGQEDE